VAEQDPGYDWCQHGDSEMGVKKRSAAIWSVLKLLFEDAGVLRLSHSVNLRPDQPLSRIGRSPLCKVCLGSISDHVICMSEIVVDRVISFCSLLWHGAYDKGASATTRSTLEVIVAAYSRESSVENASGKLPRWT
jgi:hypothetical protein